jgi:hypothetical protein
VFDLLHLDGQPTLGLPWSARRAMLDDLTLTHPHLQLSPTWPATEADVVLAVARQRGYERIMAKRVTSLYEPGHRSLAWIKTPFRSTTEVLVGGWTPGSGNRAGRIGALLVGAYDKSARLVYLGKVGTGFSAATLRHLGKQLAGLEQPNSPFDALVPRADARGAHWVDLGSPVGRGMWAGSSGAGTPSLDCSATVGGPEPPSRAVNVGCAVRCPRAYPDRRSAAVPPSTASQQLLRVTESAIADHRVAVAFVGENMCDIVGQRYVVDVPAWRRPALPRRATCADIRVA